MPAPMRKTSHLQVFSATSLMVMAPTFQSLLIMMSAYLTNVGYSHMVLKTATPAVATHGRPKTASHSPVHWPLSSLTRLRRLAAAQSMPQL